jgi:ABC-type Zn2+ transport system substrate-binding protein/surface adhesin
LQRIGGRAGLAQRVEQLRHQLFQLRARRIFVEPAETPRVQRQPLDRGRTGDVDEQ